MLSLGIVHPVEALSNNITIDCPFCVQRAKDAEALRHEGGRGKQLGAWEREILRRSGQSDGRGEHGSRTMGLPLLSEIFPERDLQLTWSDAQSPSKPVVRAAAARLEHAGLVTLLLPTRQEADRWLDTYIGRDWDARPEVRRRLLLTNFSWRTLLGEELVSRYPTALRRPASSSRIRWDTRLDEALAAATERCQNDHSELAISKSREALAHPRRIASIPRR